VKYCDLESWKVKALPQHPYADNSIYSPISNCLDSGPVLVCGLLIIYDCNADALTLI
jgi:hypothetical protein